MMQKKVDHGSGNTTTPYIELRIVLAKPLQLLPYIDAVGLRFGYALMGGWAFGKDEIATPALLMAVFYGTKVDADVPRASARSDS
jgi:hypothetical protein